MWASASIFEKVMVSGMIGSTVLFIGYTMFKPADIKKEDAFKIRQDLIQQKHVKMLYSTMSFFVLQGFKSKEPKDFMTLQTILDIERPQVVAVPISKDEYEEKYEKALQHPRFRDAIDKFKHSVKNKREKQILEVKDFNLKNLEMLYLMDHCRSLTNCKIAYVRKEPKVYQRIDENYAKLSAKQKSQSVDSNRAKIEDYTDILVQQMKPSMQFSLTPQSPFKNIVGLVEPELVEGVAKRWKEKFRQQYSHTVMEDEEVLRKEEEERNKRKEMGNKFDLGKQE